jgi:hypothetical protein
MSRPTKSLRLNASVMINRYCVQILIPCRDIDVKLGPALALNLDEPVTTETAMDARGQLRTFHGGNRGSNPRGDAKPAVNSQVRTRSHTDLVPNWCQRSVATLVRDPPAGEL